jgi:hypothetical protein
MTHRYSNPLFFVLFYENKEKFSLSVCFSLDL